MARRYDQLHERLPAIASLSGTDGSGEARSPGPLRTLLETLQLPDLTELKDPKSLPQPRPGEVPNERAVPGFICSSDPNATAGWFAAPISYRATSGDSPAGDNGPFAIDRVIRLRDAGSPAPGSSYTAASPNGWWVIINRVKPRSTTRCIPGPLAAQGTRRPRMLPSGAAMLARTGIGPTTDTRFTITRLPLTSISSCLSIDGKTAFMGASSGHLRGINLLLLDGNVTVVTRGIEPPACPPEIHEFVAHTTELQFPGIAAAGNPLNETQNPPALAGKDLIINFDVQPQPVYITSMALESNYQGDGSTVIGTEQSFFELPPAGGTNTRDNVPAPPNAVVVDFSNPLPLNASNGTLINYSQDLQLIASADSAGGASDGDFGNLGEGGLGSSGTGFTVLSDVSVVMYTLTGTTWTPTPNGGSGTRLVLTVGSTLPADAYRVYIPNQNAQGSPQQGTAIFDIYGNQLDGENLGNPGSQSSPEFFMPWCLSPITKTCRATVLTARTT